MNLHAEVAARVSQKKLSREDAISLRVCLMNASPGTLREIMSSLEAAMKLLRLVEESTETTVGKLCSKWSETRMASHKLLKKTELSNVPIHHIVDMYCLCEDAMFSSIEEVLSGAYKEPLEKDQENELDKFVDESAQLFHGSDTTQDQQPQSSGSSAANILESILVSVLRRFVMRYLLYGYVDSTHPLAYYVQCDSLWPALVAPEDFEDIFPQSILVGQAHSAQAYLNRKQPKDTGIHTPPTANCPLNSEMDRMGIQKPQI